MAGGRRVTARMVAAATAAAAVSRASESIRRFLDEVAPRELGPAAPSHRARSVASPVRLPVSGPLAPAHEEHVIAARLDPPHEFGPTPVVTPSRGIGFRSEPRPRTAVAEMPVISRPSSQDPDDRHEITPAEPVVMPATVHTAASIVRDLEDDDAVPDDEAVDADVESAVPALHLAVPPMDETPPEPVAELQEPAEEQPIALPVEPAPEPAAEPAPETTQDPEPDPEARQKGKGKKTKDATPKKDTARHRRDRSAISGTVQSSRGRGLRGMQVTVLDDRGSAVGTATTGAGGAFIVEELPAGTYRVSARDAAEEDFAPGWHGGRTSSRAELVKVKDGRTRRKVGVTLVSHAAIELDVDPRKKKAVVGITVIDRATGVPAEGAVRVSTPFFSAELPLVEGRTAVTVLGPAKKAGRGKKIAVDYVGGRHTRPASASAKLR